MRPLRVVPALALLLLAAPLLAQSSVSFGIAGTELAASEHPHYPMLHIGGFSDIDFSATNQKDVSSSSGFTEGQFILHFTATLAPRVSVFAETSITAHGGNDSYTAGVERIIVSYTHSDLLKISLGKYHTPINYWNTAFHHGLWLQTTVSRPEMIKFGGKFLPVHFLGGLVEGTAPAGGLNLGYQFGVGNGRSTSVSGAGEGGDSNNNRAWLVNLSLRPDRIYDLKFGGAFYHDRVTLPSGAGYPEQIASAFVVWNRETPEVIAEYARVTHQDEAAHVTRTSSAYYLQVAYRLPIAQARFKPYARYENMDVAEADPVYAGVPSLKRSILGVRWDVFDLVALKIEGRHDQIPGRKDSNGVFGQVAFAF